VLCISASTGYLPDFEGKAFFAGTLELLTSPAGTMPYFLNTSSASDAEAKQGSTGCLRRRSRGPGNGANEATCKTFMVTTLPLCVLRLRSICVRAIKMYDELKVVQATVKMNCAY